MMKKTLLLLVILLSFATGTSAQFRGCNAVLVTAGICDTETDGLMYFVLPDTGDSHAGATVRTRLIRSSAYQAGWRSVIPCQAERTTNEWGVITRAGVDQADCTTAQIGTQMTRSPATRRDAAWRYWRRIMQRYVSEFDDREPDIAPPPKPSLPDISPNG